MSHAAKSESTCEPNLTPLLDLVLQILMFFMVTIRASAEQTPGDIALPTSQAAHALSRKPDKDPIFINLDYIPDTAEHKVLLPRKPAMSIAEARSEIQKTYEDLKRYGEVTNPVVIRAHRDADYAKVYQLLRACSDAGFRNLKVRAIVNN